MRTLVQPSSSSRLSSFFRYTKVWVCRHDALIIGVFFLLLQLANVLVHILFENRDYEEVLWFCNVMTLYLAYGFLTRTVGTMSAVLVMSIPTQFLWNVDFILTIFGHGLGRTAWMFTDSNLLVTKAISVLIHAVTIPAALYGIWKFGFDRRAIWWMLPIGYILLPATYFLTSPYENRNCVFYPCDMNYVDNYAQIVSGGYMTTGYMAFLLAYWTLVCLAYYFIAAFIARWMKGRRMLRSTRYESIFPHNAQAIKPMQK